MKNLFYLLLIPILLFAEGASDTLTIGRGNATNKKIVAKRAAGNTNPDIRWNESNSRWEFSNDGSSWSALGSGSGGSAGINLLTNGGFEQGTTEWSASAGTFTTTSTAAHVGNGLTAGSWTPAASTNTLTTSQKTIVAGLYSQSCSAKIKFKKVDNNANHTLRVIDGSSNVLASVSLGQAATYADAYVTFVCPASGTLAVQVYAGGTDQIYVDEVSLGSNSDIQQISQAQEWGSAPHVSATNCLWTTTSGSLAVFSADSDCNYVTSNGNIDAAATKIPGILVKNVSPGTYSVTAQYKMAVSNNQKAVCALYDGTTISGYQSIEQGASEINGWAVTLNGNFTYTAAQSDKTVQLYCYVTGGGSLNVYNNADSEASWSVKKFPSSAVTVFRPDQTGWYVDANISAATNFTITAATRSSYVGIEPSDATITQNSGSASVMIPCSSTNTPTGTTCSVGNESLGVVFNAPVAGTYEACVQFAMQVDIDDGKMEEIFQIVETPVNAQTISQEGKGRVQMSYHNQGSTNQETLNGYPANVCGIFTFSSAGQKALRLFHETAWSGTSLQNNDIMLDASSNHGQRDMHWVVKKLAPQEPNPIIVNSVTSNGAGPWRTESALIGNGGSPGVSTQSGSWISSITDNGTGDSTLVFSSGAFSAAPWCTCTVQDTNRARTCVVQSTNSSSARILTSTSDAGVAVDNNFFVQCMGAK